jgi:glutamate formiminotransferase/formiminotetrahydrofolate cyclodeaminase
MTTNQPLLECIPNFSEGQNEATIDAIKAAIQAVNGQKLLHIDPSPAANRTVFTFAGTPESVIEAAFQAIKVAAERIDMRFQHGTHPRLGSTDVCPLVPLANVSMEEAVGYSKRLAERVANELNIPIYLYEYSALELHRKTLPQVRKGQYEGLQKKIKMAGWQPDFGNEHSNKWEMVSKTGATIVGARDILVAFNISLNTKDERIAKQIAQKMRSSSGGMLPELRAIGWFMEDFDCAQVSMNLLDYRITSPLKVWETCKKLTAELNVEPIGCEVVGLIPESCVLEAGGRNRAEVLTAEQKSFFIQMGIRYLGLDKVKPFNPEEKILEYALKKSGLI